MIKEMLRYTALHIEFFRFLPKECFIKDTSINRGDKACDTLIYLQPTNIEENCPKEV